MKKINAIIVDDERPARIELKFLLNTIENVEVIGESDNVDDAVELIQNKKPDLVFLDIQLAGQSGFDLLEKIAITFKVIFVTAYDEYAIKAFEVNATDYLLKPVDPVRLESSIRRVFEQNIQAKCNKLGYHDSLYVKLSNKTAKFIKLSSVVAITSVGNYTRLLANDHKTYIILKTMKQWENELPNEYFIRIHRTTIVNIEFIQKIEKYSDLHQKIFLLNMDQSFEVSRSCASRLKSIGR